MKQCLCSVDTTELLTRGCSRFQQQRLSLAVSGPSDCKYTKFASKRDATLQRKFLRNIKIISLPSLTLTLLKHIAQRWTYPSADLLKLFKLITPPHEQILSFLSNPNPGNTGKHYPPRIATLTSLGHAFERNQVLYNIQLTFMNLIGQFHVIHESDWTIRLRSLIGS